jgi:hypothetical protein
LNHTFGIYATPAFRIYALSVTAALAIAWPAAVLQGGWGSGTDWVNHQVALLRRGRRRLSVAILVTSNPSHGNETLLKSGQKGGTLDLAGLERFPVNWGADMEGEEVVALLARG